MITNHIKNRILNHFGKGFVLYGHGVVMKRKDDFVEGLHIPLNDFENVIHYLQELNYSFISMSELIQMAQKDFACSKHWVHLTFDDGYANNLNVILPFLKSMGIPFTVFISTNHVASRERFYTYRLRCALLHTKKTVRIDGANLTLDAEASVEKRKSFYKKVRDYFKNASKEQMLSLMAYIDSLLDDEWIYFNSLYQGDTILTEDELLKLSQEELVTIGSHNHNHLRLNVKFSENEIKDEMESSMKWLKEKLALSYRLAYAYPSGTKNDFSDTTISICKQTGYELGFTTLHKYVDKSTNPYAIPRLSFPKNVSKARKFVWKSIGRL
jgi:peptidoglycan/xylan/chitin deacetylase (PgdA/CDA1 family)